MSTWYQSLHKSKWKLVFGLILVATFLTRLFSYLYTYLIATDAEYFLWMAQDFASGSYTDAIINPRAYHPLYPFLISLGTFGTQAFAASAFWVSMVLSTLAVIPFFYLVKDVFDVRVALFTSLLYALSPRLLQLGGDTMNDSSFHLFFLCAVTFFWYGFRKQKPWLGIFAGVFATCAYLTRVEGIFLLVGLCFFSFSAWLFMRRAEGFRLSKLISLLVIFIAAHLVSSLPYIHQIKKFSGRWHFTMKSSMPGTVSPYYITPEKYGWSNLTDETPIAPPAKPSRIERIKNESGVFLGSVRVFFKYSIRGGDYAHLPVVFFGSLFFIYELKKKRIEAQKMGAYLFLIWVAMFWGAIFVTLYRGRNDTDVRYYLTSWIFLFPWGGYFLDRLTLLSFRLKSKALGNFIPITCVLILIGGSIVPLIRPKREDQVLMIEAGRMIQDLHGKAEMPRLLVTREKFAFYAGSRSYEAIRGSYEQILNIAKLKKTEYIVGYKRDFLNLDPSWIEKIEPEKLTLLKIENSDPEEVYDVLVYRVQDVVWN